MRPMLKRTRKRLARRSGGNCTFTHCDRMPSSPASGPAARSWAWENTCDSEIRALSCTRCNQLNRRRSQRATRWAITGSRVSPTNLFPQSSNSRSLTRSSASNDGDAIIMAQKLAASLGLGVGISSGANFLGALKVQDEMGGDAVVTTVFADDNKKYLTTDLLRYERPQSGYLTPEIELVSYEAIKRVCYTCFDGDD